MLENKTAELAFIDFLFDYLINEIIIIRVLNDY